MTRPTVPLLLALSAATLISGCSATGSQARTEMVLPAGFSASGPAAVPDRWWLAMDDPILPQLIADGLAGNPGLLATWARLAQADAAARREGASRSPTLSADASAGVSARGDGDGASAAGAFSLGLAASYEIDLWGGIGAARDAANLDVRATAADLQAAAITLSGEIAGSYFDLVEQRRIASLLARQLQTAGQTLHIVDLRLEQGVIAQTDQLRQRQVIESIAGEQALTAARIAVLEHRLAILTGRPPGAPIPALAAHVQAPAQAPAHVTEQTAPGQTAIGDGAATATAPATEPAPPLPPLPATGVPGALIQRRPDVVTSWLRVQAADRRVASAIADKFPRLSLSARASTSADTPQQLFTSWLASLVGNLVAPLIDGGQRAAAVDQARAQLSERVHGYRETVLAALAEVEDALAQDMRQAEFLASLDAQIELSRGVYARTQEAYLAGAVDYLRVLDAEDSLQSLERRRVTAEHDWIDIRLGLYRALAGGWDMKRPDPGA